MRNAVVIFFLTFHFAADASAAVFQFAMPIKTRRGERIAYLWIPPQAKQVRGVVMAGMTLMEREFVQDPRIRKACEDEQLGIVFLKCGLKATDLQKVLDDLAHLSGYRELSVAPLMFVGHSAGGPQAQEMARKFSRRCIGLVQYRGGTPASPEPIPPGIPALMMVGQFDEFGKIGRDPNGTENWERSRDSLLPFRAKHKGNLGSIVVEPGAGHFAWSDRNAEYLATFIRKAAKARIPPSWLIESKKPISLLPIDPERGWLTDLNLHQQKRCSPAPFLEYKGDPKRAAWHFDEAMAKQTVAYHRGLEKKDQFIEWKDPHWVDAGARFYFQKITWVGDGQTFKVHPAYASRYPSQYKGRGPRWAKAGHPVGHSKAPIQIKKVGGPIVVTDPGTFRIQYDELAPATETGRVTFMAFSEGDKQYRYTERVGMLPRKSGTLSNGKAQTITFEPIPNLKKNQSVKLKASSDSGLKVEFHIAYGPAKISDGKLEITEIPSRAKFPILIKVVAYQFGRGSEPYFQTAAPVSQIIKIYR